MKIEVEYEKFKFKGMVNGKTISILEEVEKSGYFENEGKKWTINELGGGLFTLDITNDLRNCAYDEII